MGITTWKEGKNKKIIVKNEQETLIKPEKQRKSLFFTFKIFHTLVSFSAYHASFNINRLGQLPSSS